MARSMGSATISFGLVAIPVDIVAATESESKISFNMLHRGCGSRLKQQYICEREQTVVTRDDTAKGYEFAKGQYVTFTTDELKRLEEASTKIIDIEEFVPESSVDQVFLAKASYLVPDGPAKGYWLLWSALTKSKRVGLARYTARGRERLVMIRQAQGGLVMHDLLYAAEVRSLQDLTKETFQPLSPGEQKLALQLVEATSEDQFRPEDYSNKLQTKIKAQIDRKIKDGSEITSLVEEETAVTAVADLMAALQRSLDDRKTSGRKVASKKTKKG